MDTILNDYIQDYLHSDKFIEMLEYFVAKYNENADSIRKSGLHKSAEFLDDAKDKLLTILDKIKAGEMLDKSDADIILNNIHLSVPKKK
ncbi:MAG: hypothetical protein E7J93_03350 [Veillonella sp.]|jgi:hypothetical protein|uniref:hypothetical protein n=1 Tax=Veillonella TaxID=29465 RepID=UPI001D0916B3|nr:MULTISPECIES: hypothetical protein [Veillonella]MCB6514091.1 hypothetical protein [Veillonella atypica]MCG4861786.1 hypothetical protein [Veillonella atypica]MDU7715367.1 hypothetical protein [Veillonella sp.]